MWRGSAHSRRMNISQNYPRLVAWAADEKPLTTNKSDTPKAVRKIAAAIDKHLAAD